MAAEHYMSEHIALFNLERKLDHETPVVPFALKAIQYGNYEALDVAAADIRARPGFEQILQNILQQTQDPRYEIYTDYLVCKTRAI